MPVDAPVREAPVLSRTAHALAAALREALAGYGTPPPLDVAPLGVRDAFAEGADEPVSGGPGASAEPGAVPVRFYGRHAVVGPFAPLAARKHDGGRACVRCLERRWQAVRSVALREALELGSGTRAAGESPYPTPFAAHALAGLVAARLAGAGPRTGTRPAVHLVDLETLTVRHYPFVPDPECPRCGTSGQDTAEAAELVLRPAPKRRPGGFRVRDIEAYDLPVEPYANPVCGSLGPSVVQDVSSTSTSATIGCFSMRSGEYLRETFWGGHADTYAESMRIGVLEGLERYAGMRPRAKRAGTTDSLNALRARGEHALDPGSAGCTRTRSTTPTPG